MSERKGDFNTLTIVMIPVAIAINIAIGQLVVVLKLPVYLDSIGTVLTGALAGPWVGALTGLLSNLVWGYSGLNVIYTPFAPVAAIIGAMAGLFSETGWFKKWWKVVLAGLSTGFVAAAVSAPIATTRCNRPSCKGWSPTRSTRSPPSWWCGRSSWPCPSASWPGSPARKTCAANDPRRPSRPGTHPAQ
ncbi:MAG: ECF transporter S component [Chloroflexota bacterium]